MTLVVKDRVKETTTTAGTGTITLAGAVSGFQSFSVIGNANTTYYAIVGGTEWEVGIGTYTLSGTTLSRDTVLDSSTGGTKVDFAAGTKDVFVTYPAEESVDQDTAQTLTNKTFDGGTVVTANSSATALRITQTGAGNALVVEDSTNPDSTPFVVDASGNVGIGTTAPSVALDVVGTIEAQAALTQDAVAIAGRAGGTSSYVATITPTTLSASRTITLPDNSGTVLTTGATVTVGQGGTGQTSYTDGQLLIGNSTGNTLTKATLTAGSGISVTNGSGSITIASTVSGGFSSMDVLTTGTSWTVPSGVTTIKVTVVGGGGGGGGSSAGSGNGGGGSGGGGGTAIRVISGVTPSSSIAYAIGAAGTAGASAGGTGGTGGTSSFGPANGTTVTATGGAGGTGATGSTVSTNGGAGGAGSGGALNSSGSSGGGALAGTRPLAIGGSSSFGGGGRGANNTANAGTAGGNFGGGGGGGWGTIANAAAGGAGAAGVIIVEY